MSALATWARACLGPCLCLAPLPALAEVCDKEVPDDWAGPYPVPTPLEPSAVVLAIFAGLALGFVGATAAGRLRWYIGVPSAGVAALLAMIAADGIDAMKAYARAEGCMVATWGAVVWPWVIAGAFAVLPWLASRNVRP